MSGEKLSRYTTLLLFLLSGLMTIILYGRSLSLPFYSDDLVQLAWLRDLTLGSLWGQVSPYDYYRPLAFSVWVLWRDIGLPVTPSAFRGINLLLHTVASGLVGMLAQNLHPEKNPLSGAIATLLFVAFPFSYQAVIWVSAIFYPMVVSLTVGATLTYRRWASTRDRRWLIASAFLAGIAPFAHENGMLAGGLVGMVAIIMWVSESTETRNRLPDLTPLIGIGLNVVFLIGWLMMRSGGVQTLDLSLGNLSQNMTLLIMGLSFPFTPILYKLGVSPALAVWTTSLIAIGLLIYLMRKHWMLALLCLGWFVLSILPVLITMRFDWLVDAPRFLYPAAVASAMWWGLALASESKDIKEIVWRAALVGIIIIPALIFIRTGVGFHLLGEQALRFIARPNGPNSSILLVNIPDRLEPSEPPIYPYFTGGAILMPPQVPADNRAATIGALLTEVPYTRTTYGDIIEQAEAAELIESGIVVYVADYSQTPLQMRYAGSLHETDQALINSIGDFGESISLLHADYNIVWGTLQLQLVWQASTITDSSPTVFVHILDESGQIVGQSDGDPISGLYSFVALGISGEVVNDGRWITLPGPGTYRVMVGVWDQLTGDRLTVTNGDADNRLHLFDVVLSEDR